MQKHRFTDYAEGAAATRRKQSSEFFYCSSDAEVCLITATLTPTIVTY